MKILPLLLLFAGSMVQAMPQAECEGRLAGRRDARRWAEASALGLNPATPADFSITRRPFRDGFRFYDRKGERITSPRILQRLESLKISPSLTDVRVSTDPLSHVQAYGTDGSDKVQRIYQPLWVQARDKVKFERMVSFGQALPTIRAKAAADFRSEGLTKKRVLGALVILLDHTYIRVGNPQSAEVQETFGLTTMLKAHIRLDGEIVRFKFTPKGHDSDEPVTVTYEDAEMAAFIRELRALEGESMFQYRNADGAILVATAEEVNDYLAQISGQDFTAKEFRTWGATVTAAGYLRSVPYPATDKEMTNTLAGAADAAADALTNTRAISRKSYIHPALFAAYQEGDLWDQAFAASRPTARLSRLENAILVLLGL